jgi:predicted nucleotidyltransferase
MAHGHLDEYPARVREALSRLIASLEPLAPEPSALVVYGSLAKGTYRDGESDVNLAIVLNEVRTATLFALGPPLRAAYRAVRVQPFVVGRREIPRIADVFAVKLADIRDAHHVISGEDPFASVVIEREHLRLRAEQELRNHLMRLRRHAILGDADARELARALYATAGSIAIELAALLEVAGKPRPGLAPREALRTASEAFDLDAATLDRLCDLREGVPLAEPRALYEATLALLTSAADVADRLEVDR